MTEDYKTKYPIGIKWKTRGGDIVTVIYHNDGSYRRAIVVVRLKDGVPIGLYNNGGCFDDGQGVLDLIEPYVEPKRGVWYLNVYDDDGCMAAYAYKTKLEADKSADKERLSFGVKYCP